VIGFTGIYIDYNEEQNSGGFHASQGWPQQKKTTRGIELFRGEHNRKAFQKEKSNKKSRFA